MGKPTVEREGFKPPPFLTVPLPSSQLAPFCWEGMVDRHAPHSLIAIYVSSGKSQQSASGFLNIRRHTWYVWVAVFKFLSNGLLEKRSGLQMAGTTAHPFPESLSSLIRSIFNFSFMYLKCLGFWVMGSVSSKSSIQAEETHLLPYKNYFIYLNIFICYYTADFVRK